MSVSSLSALLTSAAGVGVSGSRSPSAASCSACRWALRQLAPSASVVTGCAPGVDALTRARCTRVRVVRASAFAGTHPRGALAARSVAVVRSVASAAGGAASVLWLSFPAGPCPACVLPSPSPSACFSGAGSGSWASLALAVGLGVPVLVFLPAGVAPPAGWPLTSVPGCAGPRGSWLRFRPAVVQSALFA